MLAVGLRRVFSAVAACAALGVLVALAFPRQGPQRDRVDGAGLPLANLRPGSSPGAQEQREQAEQRQ